LSKLKHLSGVKEACPVYGRYTRQAQYVDDRIRRTGAGTFPGNSIP